MITHAGVKRVEVLTEEEKQRRDEKANKVLEMTEYFFKVRKQQLPQHDDPLVFSELMAKLCPELGSIYNYRREYLLIQFSNLKEAIIKNGTIEDANKLTKLIQKEFELDTILIKKHPKSYTLWTHRQWIVLQSQDIDNLLKQQYNDDFNPPLINAVKQEYGLCDKMLQLDERNFHVWNYRNWLTSISQHQQEDEFTKKKIEQNFSNFSAYHFRSKYLLRTYNSLDVIAQRCLENVNGVVPIPLNRIQEELDLIQQAIYIQPKEHGVYQYHRWLLAVIQPFGLIGAFADNDDKTIITLLFNKAIKLTSGCVEIRHQEELHQYQLLKPELCTCAHQIKLPNNLDIFTIQLHNLILNGNNDTLVDEDIDSKFCIPSRIECKYNDNTLFTSVVKINDTFAPVFDEIMQLINSNIDFIEETLIEEPNNKFALIQLLYLISYKQNTSVLNPKVNIIDTALQVQAKADSICRRLLEISNDHQAQYFCQHWNNRGKVLLGDEQVLESNKGYIELLRKVQIMV